MEVPRPAYGFEFGEPPKDIRSSYDVVVIGLGGTNSDLRKRGGYNIIFHWYLFAYFLIKS